MMIKDLVGYLPTDILTKVDRSSMAVSLEVRSPFLDKDIVKFALTLPKEYKIKGDIQKSVLKDVLYKYIPKDIIDRPKMGFGVPLTEWLRGDLRDWCEDLLDENKLNENIFFKTKIIRNNWKLFLEGKKDFSNQLWIILMFQSWLYSNKN